MATSKKRRVKRYIPKSEWVWYGFAGHFIGGSRCRFHLSTRIGKYLISTVGGYRPLSSSGVDQPLSYGNDMFYETMVFACDGETPAGDPNVLDFGRELLCERYKDSKVAELNHHRICKIWSRK